MALVVALAVGDGEPVFVGEPVDEAVADSDGVALAECDALGDAEPVLVDEAVAERPCGAGMAVAVELADVVAMAVVDDVALAEEVSDGTGLANVSASPASDGAEEAVAASEKVARADPGERDAVALAERDPLAEYVGVRDHIALGESDPLAESDGILLAAMAVQKT